MNDVRVCFSRTAFLFRFFEPARNQTAHLVLCGCAQVAASFCLFLHRIFTFSHEIQGP